MTDVQFPPLAGRRLQLVALAAALGVTLGLGIQGLIISVRFAADIASPSAKALADAAGGVTWSAVVCSGVAIGIGASRHRERLFGLLGLVTAPLAYALAKAAQKGVGALAGEPGGPVDLVALQLAGLKAVEYAAFGLVLGWLMSSGRSTLLRHALVGLAFGALFGGLALGLEAANGSIVLAKAIGLTVNEVLFPIGCASVLHLIHRLSSGSS